ncbi:hypothetical protein DYB35_012124 [Aphanomyces astaci]|uniref:DDE-1 domain-containing protein n=1 Tax=Aphanomyces astaci TaxID=112090 RepID=A0A418D344_APHAT|nr:hypothetical protein DYB35_012124 [Aphanomyces astaci]
MNSDLFDSWLESFGEWKLRERAARPALLVLDNCSSHLPENSLTICEAYGIYLARLPPNATHLLQPLDVALFRTFKRMIARAVTQRLQSLNVTTLPRQAAIHIAGEAFNAVFPAVNGVQEQNKSVVNGFSTCGIWPLSLPKMLRRLSMAKANSVSDNRGNAPWLKTKTYARDEMLTLPPKMKGRKRVQTELEWHTRKGVSNTFSRELIDFMESVRQGEHFLTTAHLVTWLKMYQPDWLAEYMSSKPTDERAYKSLVQWCLRFANRHGYHHRVPCPAKKTQVELAETQQEFSTEFFSSFGYLSKHGWINVDETPRVWNMYLREVLKPELDYPSVLLTDNLKCHVSKKSYKIMRQEMYSGAFLQPLPANTTSVLQPLDVGVMGPFKSMCRTEWIKEGKVVTAAEKRIAMIKRAIKVWNDMKEDRIRKSFEKALNIFEV